MPVPHSFVGIEREFLDYANERAVHCLKDWRYRKAPAERTPTDANRRNVGVPLTTVRQQLRPVGPRRNKYLCGINVTPTNAGIGRGFAETVLLEAAGHTIGRMRRFKDLKELGDKRMKSVLRNCSGSARCGE
jgi:hypothetical protein